MSDDPIPLYQVGTIVMHPKRPEWGPGRVRQVHLTRLSILFRDRPIEPGKPPDVTVDTRYVELPLAEDQGVHIPDPPPPIVRAPAKKTTKRPSRRTKVSASFEDAVEQFQGRFPRGFEDPLYLDEERSYKWEAHEQWLETLGGGQAEALLAAGDVEELRARAMAVEARPRVPLLSPFEKAPFRDGLKDDTAARGYFESLLELLALPAIEPEALDRYFHAVDALPVEPGRKQPASWTTATILPFLAAPDRFMFLKPQATKECAARLRFDLGYRPQLNGHTYRRLLDMSESVLERLKPLGARDYIDVQSFVYRVWLWGQQPVRASESR